MPHIIKLTQSGSDKYDFQSSTVNVLSRYSPAPYDPKAMVVDDQMTLNPRGTTIAAFLDNLNTLNRTLEDAQDNFDQSQLGYPYTPIYLRFQQDGATYAVQAEVFGGETGEIENYISGALRGRLIHNLPFKLKRRPYFEETAAQSLFSNTVSNNNNPTAISGVRGDVPAPLKITVQTNVASQSRIIIGCRVRGTIANFTPRYQAEDAIAGTNVAPLVDADLNGGNGLRWTPVVGDVTAEQDAVATWVITDPTDQLGVFRVYVRCRDNAATCNVKIRVKAGITTAGNTEWGDYGDSPKYADGNYTAGGSVVGGTASLPLVDCGIIQLPPIDTNGAIPENISICISGQSNALYGAGNEFDIDEIFLMPTMELPYGGGFQVITLPENLGNDTNPIAIIDANDRAPRGYLDTSGTLQQVAADIRGKPLYAWTNKSMRLFILTQNSNGGRHRHDSTNTVVVTATPRYRYPGRGT